MAAAISGLQPALRFPLGGRVSHCGLFTSFDPSVGNDACSYLLFGSATGHGYSGSYALAALSLAKYSLQVLTEGGEQIDVPMSWVFSRWRWS